MTLQGRAILVTRATHQQAELVGLLEAQGAQPILYPCLAIVPPDDVQPLQSALAALSQGAFDWLILTSPNTVQALTPWIRGRSIPAQVAVIGPKTAHLLTSEWQHSPQLIPEDYHSGALGGALPIQAGMRVLLPQSDLADAELADLLRQRGAEVISVTAYQTQRGWGGAELSQTRLDALTFTSPSAIDYFLERISAEGISPAQFAHLPAACLGHKTAQALTFGPRPLLARQATLPALVQSLVDYFDHA